MLGITHKPVKDLVPHARNARTHSAEQVKAIAASIKLKASERGEKRVHPTQKPIALAEWCFDNYGNPATVIDLFLGSGSTLIACEKTNRTCYGMEIDPHYCSVVIQRWQQYTEQIATRVVQ